MDSGFLLPSACSAFRLSSCHPVIKAEAFLVTSGGLKDEKKVLGTLVLRAYRV